MALTPVEIRHLKPSRGFFGYGRDGVDKLLAEIADSFEGVWRERADLADKVEHLESDLERHKELEGLLRTTLVSAERAAQDLRDQARRDADGDRRRGARRGARGEPQGRRRTRAARRRAAPASGRSLALGARDRRRGERPTSARPSGSRPGRSADSSRNLRVCRTLACDCVSSPAPAAASSAATVTAGRFASRPRRSGGTPTRQSSRSSRILSALARGDVTLVSGGASRDKIVEVAGIPPEETERRLAAARGVCR